MTLEDTALGGGGGVIVLAFLLAAKINMRETVRDASFRNVGSDLEIPIPPSKRIVTLF